MTARISTSPKSAIFSLQRLADGLLAARDDRVRLDADGAQLIDRVLRGLALELLARVHVRHQRQMHVADVVASDVVLHLPDRLEERQRLDVTDGAADLDDHDIRLRQLIFGHAQDAMLDLVGDVRDDLHGAAEIVAAAFLGDHRRIDLAGGDVARLAQRDVDETLVVAEVEIGLSAVVGDEHLAVLIRRHRARIDVEIGVELLHPDVQPARLEDRADRGGGDSLAE